jgi:Undecaprenyl-phosphate glucose phosphotransferase
MPGRPTLRLAPEAPDPVTATPVAAPAQLAPAEPVVLKARTRRPRDRRGPLRPGQLASVRERSSGWGLSILFRGVDAALIFGLTWYLFDLAVPAGLLGSPLSQGAPFLMGAAMAVTALKGTRAYDFSHSEKLHKHLIKVAASFAAAGAVVAVALAVLAPRPELLTHAALWCAAVFVLTYLTHVWWWAIVRDWRRAGRLTPNIVIVGATPNAERLIASALATREVAVLGVFDDRLDRAPDEILGVPVLGTTAELMEHRLLPFVDRIVITVTPAAQARVRGLIDKLRVLPNAVTLLLDDGFTAPKALSRLADAPLTLVSGRPEDQARALSKRAQDVVIGTAALVLTSPLLMLTALAVKLDSPGPILFKQRRHGFNNEDIMVWKFRSMRHDAADQGAFRQIQAGDTRVTRVGRFIRKTSLDELPQIYNVLKGEMSLVGPRPHSPTMRTGDVESHRLVAEYAHRHRMKPGMTGWAAIRGSRGPVDTPEAVQCRVALDVEYIERQSLWLDLYIMLMTIPCLLGDRDSVR